MFLCKELQHCSDELVFCSFILSKKIKSLTSWFGQCMNAELDCNTWENNYIDHVIVEKSGTFLPLIVPQSECVC